MKPKLLKDSLSLKMRLLENQTFAEIRATELLKEHLPMVFFQQQKTIKTKVKQWEKKTEVSPRHKIVLGKHRYIADIFIPGVNIIIELDGGVHNTRENYDTRRDLNLMKNGKYLVIRFPNSVIVNTPDKFIYIVKKSIEERELQGKKVEQVNNLSFEINNTRSKVINTYKSLLIRRNLELAISGAIDSL